MQVTKIIKSEIQGNAAWPFAIALILVNEFGRQLFYQPSVMSFLISPWYIPTFIVLASFIAYLFLQGLVGHQKRYKNWIPPHRYNSWKLKVAYGGSALITMELASILIFFICLFVWAGGAKPTEKLELWLDADMVFGLFIVPIIGKYYFWTLKKQF